MGPWYWKYRKLFDSSTTERQTKFARVSCVIYKWMYAKIYNEILKVEYDFDRSTWMSLVLLSISWKFKIPRFGKIGSVCTSKGVLAIVLIIRFRKI